MNKWQTITDMEVNKGDENFLVLWQVAYVPRNCKYLVRNLQKRLIYCPIFAGKQYQVGEHWGDRSGLWRYFFSTFSEFLIHAADVEGLCQGIDKELVERKGP